jgi:hypothetical protein
MDLQNYSRSRKSKRIQQPEAALDSKTCSAFPEMAAGSSFVRMSDGLLAGRADVS